MNGGNLQGAGEAGREAVLPLNKRHLEILVQELWQPCHDNNCYAERNKSTNG